MVSLGAFGGSITLQFSSGIKNDANNPYGVDFTVFGNPTPTWSEPGIIQVLKDENKNGLPDDTGKRLPGVIITGIQPHQITKLPTKTAV